MIVFKDKNAVMIEKISKMLDSKKIEDYEISDYIPESAIGIDGSLNDPEIYLPDSFEYDQFDLCDFIRNLNRTLRTTITPDRDIIRIKLRGTLTDTQYCKLVEYIINLEGYAVIVQN